MIHVATAEKIQNSNDRFICNRIQRIVYFQRD
jgi:hypothetical protein